MHSTSNTSLYDLLVILVITFIVKKKTDTSLWRVRRNKDLLLLLLLLTHLLTQSVSQSVSHSVRLSVGRLVGWLAGEVGSASVI